MNRLKSLRQAITVLAAGAFFYAGCGEKEQSLVNCLIEKNVRLYSANWCAPCHQQEQLLEEALGQEEWNYFKENLLIQCYGELQYSPIQLCEDKNIGAYPAWEFLGGNPEWMYGVQSLEEITEWTACEEP